LNIPALRQANERTAVVNVSGLLDRIKDGDSLTVDDDAGTVKRVATPQAD